MAVLDVINRNRAIQYTRYHEIAKCNPKLVQYLIIIATLFIGSMILMKVLNLVVNKNGWRQIFIDSYRNLAVRSCIDRCIDTTLGVRTIIGIILYNTFKDLIGETLNVETYAYIKRERAYQRV